MSEPAVDREHVASLLTRCDAAFGDLKSCLLHVLSPEHEEYLEDKKFSGENLWSSARLVLRDRWIFFLGLGLGCPCVKGHFDVRIWSPSSLDVCARKLVALLDQLRAGVARIDPVRESWKLEPQLEAVLDGVREFVSLCKNYDHLRDNAGWKGFSSAGTCLHGFLLHHLNRFVVGGRARRLPRRD